MSARSHRRLRALGRVASHGAGHIFAIIEDQIMTFSRPLSFVALAGLSLAACSPEARNDSAEAADTIAADTNATMREAVDDVDAASERAFGSAESAIDNNGDAIGNAADRAADRTGEALRDAGNEISE